MMIEAGVRFECESVRCMTTQEDERRSSFGRGLTAI